MNEKYNVKIIDENDSMNTFKKMRWVQTNICVLCGYNARNGHDLIDHYKREE